MGLVMDICEHITVLDSRRRRSPPAHPQRDAERPEGDRGLPRGRRCARGSPRPELELSLSRSPTATGAHALKGVGLRVDEGEVVALIGANGAGKTHDAARDLRAASSRAAGASASQGRDITGMPARRDRAARHGALPRRAAALRRHDRRREPRDGAPCRSATRRADRERSRAHARAVPARSPSGCQPARRHALRRRAADARDRARAACPGRACCCSTSRRWASRPLIVRLIFRSSCGSQGRGHDDPAGRAERAPGAADRDRATCSRRAGSRGVAQRRACSATRRSSTPYMGGNVAV